MPAVTVNVKWGKQKFDNVEVNTDEPPETFKAQLFALSGVPPDRQKLLMKGKTIQDDAWGDIKLTNGSGIMMMGSTEGVPTGPPPAASSKDGKDPSSSAADEEDDNPLGLMNLGNTCYLNATVQCFRAIPELRKALKNFSGSFAGFDSEQAKSQSVTQAVKVTYDEMDRNPEKVVPVVLVETMRKAYPRFAERGEHGGYAQQDANEAWTELMNNLKKQLGAATPNSNVVDQYLRGEFAVTMKCKESETEPVVQFREPFLQLSCFINQDVKYLQAGLAGRLRETITKHSETLGRDAEFEKVNKIDRLPAYLTVQLVRFFFKERAAVGAKILKDVKFPFMLDVFDLCSEVLQKKLVPMRQKFKDTDDYLTERAIKLTKGLVKEDDDEPHVDEPFSFSDDVGSNNSGFYELQAVLTHQGRTNNSGHYVGWVKRGDIWLKFDDDKVSGVHPEEILKLSGGGDWHCAYLLLYGPRPLRTYPKPATETTAPATTAKSGPEDMPVD
ncbi:hypothetical protein RvY_12921 [Ramazzottius varieornatus]|uniref:Ubiquitin carboxyl-terminal hydrolase n=1 Tax=Ramazzottius varieornatus TaxID=947166 RepID=A0A1D1VRI4_RAMVA|nr:hypothetical protein RvY_12921 [Ramazzottius varieornatus]